MQLLKERNFFVLWVGQLASIFGNRFSEFAIPLIVLQLTGSPWQAGLVAVCSQVAPLVLAIPAGTWIENKSKKRIAMTAEIVRVFAMTGLVFAVSFDVINVWLMAWTLLIMGAAGVFFRISFNTMVPAIVGRKQLVQAHNYFEGADAISTLSGPALAGLVFATFGIGWTLAIDSVTFLISFIGIMLLQYDEKMKVTKERNSAYKDTVKGLRYLIGNRIQRFITFNHVILNFSTTAVVLTVIIFANQTLELSVVRTGLLLSAAGVGNVAGVFLLSRLNGLSWGFLNGSIMLVSGVGVGLLVVTDSFITAALGMFLFDGALSMGFVVNGAARQAITPDDFLARVGSGGILLSGLVAVGGTLFAGGVSELLSPRVALGVCGLLLMLSTVVSWMVKEIRKPLHEVKPIELAN